MPWRTVKSSLQGWSKLSSTANPSVSVLSSPTIHPFTHLYLCFSDEDKGKHSLIRWLPGTPSLLSSSLGLFRRDSQAWLAIVTWPHGGRTGTHKQTHARPGTHTHIHTNKCKASTHMWHGGGQGPVLLGLITPWARPREKRWGWEKRDFCLF